MGNPFFEINNQVATKGVLELCKRLERAVELSHILHAMAPLIEDVLGYHHVWLALIGDRPGFVTIVSQVSSDAAMAETQLKAQTMDIPIAGDAMLTEILAANHVVVVDDARTDPRTNKDVVAQLDNRTIVNVPLLLADMRLGVFGVGTFGDAEGVRPPLPWQIDFMQVIAGHVAVALDRVRFLEARKKAEDAMAFQALHDELTGLGNRRAFDKTMLDVFEETRGQAHEHVVCYLDLDEFKVVNDTCGHSAGDVLLRQIAHLFKEALRADDHIFRIGGDEFGMVLTNHSIAQAHSVAKRLQSALADFKFMWHGQGFGVSASIGMVALNAASESVGALLQAADSACYVAKESGRGRIHVYTKDDAALSQRFGVMEWVSRIEDALTRDRFVLYAQPIMPLGVGTHSGLHCELLLRMQDEQGALIAPGQFMPTVERYHLAARVDRWVLAHALQWLAAHQEQIDVCAINLSGQSLGDAPFMDFALQQLADCGVPCHKLCFEITETAAIGNLHTAMPFIHALREKGCKLALDDFGSGMSSFAYLRNLPVDILKIDGHFVKDIAKDAVSLAMVKSIHDIGCLMNKETVAEFVESQEILALLRGLGVHHAQGYAIGFPMPLDQVLHFKIPASS